MEIKADLHCHTVASTHAYSTVWELAKYASSVGLEAIAVTDHSPALPDAPHIWHFENLSALPRTLEGVTLLRGAEVNITDISGSIDLPEYILKRLDIVVASIHSPCYSARDRSYARVYESHRESVY